MSEVPLISIVDDDALARDGIRELVEGQDHVQKFLAECFARYRYGAPDDET